MHTFPKDNNGYFEPESYQTHIQKKNYLQSRNTCQTDQWYFPDSRQDTFPDMGFGTWDMPSHIYIISV